MREAIGAALRALLGGPSRDELRLLVVAAHPDDETIGASSLLAAGFDVAVLHVTDGAPRDERFVAASWQGRGWGAYRAERQRELDGAMAALGVDRGRMRRLDVPDLGAADELPAVVRGVAAALRDTAPHLVVTHSYEGGHPDHDAVAVAARLAVDALRERGPALVEMALYNAAGKNVFLPRADSAVASIDLDAGARERKATALGRFASQREVLRDFPVDAERFRRAPRYDFATPPHAGELPYEALGMANGAAWRETIAARARQLR